MINHNHISEKIKYYRKKNQISQDELSQRSGIHVSTIKKYECGLRNPKPAQLMKIAAALGISNNELLSYDLSYQKEVASLWVKLHQEGLITLAYKTDAAGNCLPESISISHLSADIQKAIAQALQAAADDSKPKQAAETAAAPKAEKVAPAKAEPKTAPAKAEPKAAPVKVEPKATPVNKEPAPVKEAPVSAKPEPAVAPKTTDKAPDSLDGTVGTGRIISKHMELFRFKFNSTMKFNGQDCLTFDWTYNKQGGIAIIRKTPEGDIEDTSSLTCKKNKGNFRHPLSIQKDHSLHEVFEKMLASRERFSRK